jgi:putative acetyltransferase
MQVSVRDAAPDDAGAIAKLFHETVHTVNARDYTQEQVDAWAPRRFSAEEWQRRMRGKRVWVAVDRSRIVGFAELEPSGHIDCFYCHKDYQGRGVGTCLLARLEGKARQLGLDRIFAEASITARPFFERRGFAVVRAQHVERSGVLLCNFMMEKFISEKPI